MKTDLEKFKALLKAQHPATFESLYGEWERDCNKWRDNVLTGKYWHWCSEWDGLPMDETCIEWPCNCALAHVLQGKRD